ncbi:MAG: hypothetical protein QW607_09475 [Desulfurococcaceae archaeon]
MRFPNINLEVRLLYEMNEKPNHLYSIDITPTSAKLREEPIFGYIFQRGLLDAIEEVSATKNVLYVAKNLIAKIDYYHYNAQTPAFILENIVFDGSFDKEEKENDVLYKQRKLITYATPRDIGIRKITIDRVVRRITIEETETSNWEVSNIQDITYEEIFYSDYVSTAIANSTVAVSQNERHKVYRVDSVVKLGLELIISVNKASYIIT